eukprot:TRINITY_DN66378_c0_g1_i1.p1 TRINITY_DN66378_c0_g1~~TRINITY_DN66378_c0_g1_i1.p1  ORF type:complete len:251 (+),score=39.37 TRINITY_DN66378_c0_g1_i1:25-753(+)
MAASPWRQCLLPSCQGIERRCSAVLLTSQGRHKQREGPSHEVPEGQGTPQQPSSNRFDVNHWKRSLADLFSAPLTHLLWSQALRFSLARVRPDLWDAADFHRGVETAVHVVYNHLAQGDFAELRSLGLLDDGLLMRLEYEPSAAVEEAWSKPPELISARVLGLLWAKLIVTDSSQLDSDVPRLRLTSLVLCKEAYSHKDVSEAVNVRRLQRWTFERSLEPGSVWTILQIGPESWYWKRPFEE